MTTTGPRVMRTRDDFPKLRTTIRLVRYREGNVLTGSQGGPDLDVRGTVVETPHPSFMSNYLVIRPALGTEFDVAHTAYGEQFTISGASIAVHVNEAASSWTWEPVSSWTWEPAPDPQPLPAERTAADDGDWQRKIKREHVVTFIPLGVGNEIAGGRSLVDRICEGLSALGYEVPGGSQPISIGHAQDGTVYEITYGDGRRIGLDSWENAVVYALAHADAFGQVEARTRITVLPNVFAPSRKR